MPLTDKGAEILSSLQKEYGEKHGKEVLYAGKNSGRFTGIDEACAKADAATNNYAEREKKRRRLGDLKATLQSYRVGRDRGLKPSETAENAMRREIVELESELK